MNFSLRKSVFFDAFTLLSSIVYVWRNPFLLNDNSRIDLQYFYNYNIFVRSIEQKCCSDIKL